MRLTFNIHYHTQWGQNVYVCGNIPALGNWNPAEAVAMQLRQNNHWMLSLDIPNIFPLIIEYKYFIRDQEGEYLQWEFGENRSLCLEEKRFTVVDLKDVWRSKEGHTRSWFSDAFTSVLAYPSDLSGEIAHPAPIANTLHRFQLYAPRVGRNHHICLIGEGDSLGAWDEKKAIIMDGSDYPLWKVEVKLQSKENEALAYKYGIYDHEAQKIVSWEAGEDRWIQPVSNARQKRLVVQNDHLFRYEKLWRGVGISIPVFSLRTQDSWGVGEFNDLHLLIDWADQTAQKLIQILPINDTVATHSWKDSYPYAAISVFALHPLYLNPVDLCRHYGLEIPDEFEKTRLALNALEQVDYEEVMKLKSRLYKWVFEEVKAHWWQEEAYLSFFEARKSWLLPYAAFSSLRDFYSTPNFRQWDTFQTYNETEIAHFCSVDQAHHDDIAIHYFIQYHLHLQLLAARNYAKEKGIVLKGDIPIGIYRHSVDAWVAPELYHMQSQAGAPPDDFAVSGQNWGFPTYNWEEMAKDGYQWWRDRLSQMATYFDAYRIDHILGFFRIWEIPYHSVEGLLGHFNPDLPVTKRELDERGIWLDDQRLCKPYIRYHILEQLFGTMTPRVIQLFLEETQAGEYTFKEQFQGQRNIADYLAARDDLSDELRRQLKEGLFSLTNEVLLLNAVSSNGQLFHPRISMQHTRSYQELDNDMQHKLNELYNDYFYHRQEDFWRQQALTKLPPITQATRMLVCGEDLGMVPACVPGVMDELGILSLRIQRMPHQGEFGRLEEVPYMSVVSPSSHDMSTLRAWWEEDREKSQRFFNNVLGFEGEAPYFLEPWVAQAIIHQHLTSSAMWAIFPLQDLLAMDPDLRWEQTQKERINIPAIPQHYWRYRMHISLEMLIEATSFNLMLAEMIGMAGRDTDF